MNIFELLDKELDKKGNIKKLKLCDIHDKNNKYTVNFNALGDRESPDVAVWNNVRFYHWDEQSKKVAFADKNGAKFDKSEFQVILGDIRHFYAPEMDGKRPINLGFFIGDIDKAEDVEPKHVRVGVDSPYHHVPLMVKEGRNITHKISPSGHADYLEDAISGSLNCTIECLTESHFGNFQLPLNAQGTFDGLKQRLVEALAEDEQEPNQTELEEGKKEIRLPNKKVIVPNFVNNSGIQKALINGSSIMGMLRNNVASLVSAPMQRVAEKTLSYRPNMVVPDAKKGHTNFKPFLGVISCGSAANNKRVSLYSFGRDTVSFGKAGEYSSEKDYQYFGGIDSDGELACHFKNKTVGEESMVYKTARFNKPPQPRATLPISDDLIVQFKKTTQHLTDSKYGHISSQHPHSAKFREEQLSKSIEANRDIDSWFKDRKKELLIYVEARLDNDDKPVEIVSFGNNYRYRWRYRDSVRYLDSSKSNPILRPELALSEEEAFYFWNALKEQGARHELPKALNLARSLFGDVYQRDELMPKNTPKSSGTYDRFAGKVSVNHAVEFTEQLSEQSVSSQGVCYAVPRPGSPKANSEHNLVQDPHSPELSTWGTNPDEPNSLLAGRKVYRHQKKGTNFNISNGEAKTNIKEEHAPLLYCVSPRKTKYRTSIRFKGISKLELGLLVIAVDPNYLLNNEVITLLPKKVGKYLTELMSASGAENESNERIFANKLGYGRPLGMGSVDFKIDSENLVKAVSGCEVDTPKLLESIDNSKQFLKEAVTFAIEELTSGFQNESGASSWDEILMPWLILKNYRNAPDRLSYPTETDGDEQTIVKYHSDVRTNQLKQRRLPSEVKNDSLDGFQNSYYTHGLLKPISKIKEARSGK